MFDFVLIIQNYIAAKETPLPVPVNLIKVFTTLVFADFVNCILLLTKELFDSRNKICIFDEIKNHRFSWFFNMNDISEILQMLLDKHAQAEDAASEFKMMIDSDRALMTDYKDWCKANGYGTRSGYREYLDEFLSSRDSIWENINE